jgi:hypothetical protein
MNDDAPFIPKRFMAYSRDKWWDLACNTTQNNGDQGTMTNPPTYHPGQVENWECEQATCGWEGFNGLVAWWNEKATASMKTAYTAHLGGNPLIPSGCWQDVIHIPKAMVPFYAKLASEMPYLQCEIFNNMVHLLWAATGGQSEHIPGYEVSWDLNNDPSHHRGSLPTLEERLTAALVHPLKFSDQSTWATFDTWLFNSR